MSSDDLHFLTIKGVDYSELDFHEIDEKLKSEIPIELKYQINNVLSLIKETIEKLKISLILPKILENPKILQEYVNHTKYNNCLKLVQDYRTRQKTQSLMETKQSDYYLLKIIDYFQENYKMLEVLPNWLDDIDNTEKCLLTAFEDVYQVAQERFYRPAMADLAKEKRLHEVYLANEEVKKNIKDISRKIQNKKLNRLWKTAAKTGVIKKLEEELAFHQYDNNLFVKQEISNSHREIQQINFNFTNKQQELEEELEKARLTYERKLKEDLIQERNVRDERNKLQLQLQSLIAKYDKTIYDKYKEEIILQEEYDKEKQEFDIFLIEYKREDAIYEELVRKKECEFQQLHEAKILLFTHTRAAKKIQRWWKKYLRAQKQLQKKAAKTKEKVKEKDDGAKGKTMGKSGNKEANKKTGGKEKKK
ncbi:GRIP and coiled-coil domain-containing protein-like [Lucilia cuprina]|uniref:GRIP and coiled-coil domain-containing protein-like n=1 Tax=Lucilia cuprina TaxID=7375 RepID=UPI001F05FD94|nr:GRIP and coiled-coil domain-containing protein-like [Lucilia cuprina]